MTLSVAFLNLSLGKALGGSVAAFAFIAIVLVAIE